MVSSHSKNSPLMLSQPQRALAPATPSMVALSRELETSADQCRENYAAVEEEAYKIYERNGSKHGDDVHDWMAAEAQVNARSKPGFSQLDVDLTQCEPND